MGISLTASKYSYQPDTFRYSFPGSVQSNHHGRDRPFDSTAVGLRSDFLWRWHHTSLMVWEFWDQGADVVRHLPFWVGNPLPFLVGRVGVFICLSKKPKRWVCSENQCIPWLKPISTSTLKRCRFWENTPGLKKRWWFIHIYIYINFAISSTIIWVYFDVCWLSNHW